MLTRDRGNPPWDSLLWVSPIQNKQRLTGKSCLCTQVHLLTHHQLYHPILILTLPVLHTSSQASMLTVPHILLHTHLQLRAYSNVLTHSRTVTIPCTYPSSDTRSHSHLHNCTYPHPQSLPQHTPVLVCSDTPRYAHTDTPVVVDSCHSHPSHNPAVITQDPSLSPHPPPRPHTGRLWRQRAAAAAHSCPSAPCPADAQPACPHHHPALPARWGRVSPPLPVPASVLDF